MKKKKQKKDSGNEKQKISGHVHYVLKDKNGKIKKKGVAHNVITNAGLSALTAKYLTDVGGVSNFLYVALGTDNTAPAATDTALGNEITTNGGSRTNGTGSLSGTSGRITAKFTFTGTLAIEEAGLFNASSGGTMLSRVLFLLGVIDGDYLQIFYDISFP